MEQVIDVSALEPPEPLEQILDDFRQHILPGMTVWNHPGFMAYFNSTASPASPTSHARMPSSVRIRPGIPPRRTGSGCWPR